MRKFTASDKIAFDVFQCLFLERTCRASAMARGRIGPSNRNLPAAVAAAYSPFWVSVLQTGLFQKELSECLRPKWRRSADKDGPKSFCTGDLLRQLRFEIPGSALRPATFSHFVNQTARDTKPEKLRPSLPGMLLGAT